MRTKSDIPAAFGVLAVVWVAVCLSIAGGIVWAAVHFLRKFW